MDVIYPRCCGLDVHKSSITACVLTAEGSTRKRVQRRFGTVTAEIIELAKWSSANLRGSDWTFDAGMRFGLAMRTATRFRITDFAFSSILGVAPST